jgi:hypothetical protein
MHSFIEGVESTLEQRKDIETAKINMAFKQKKMSPRTYEERKEEIERWVVKERNEFQEKKKIIQQGWNQAS